MNLVCNAFKLAFYVNMGIFSWNISMLSLLQIFTKFRQYDTFMKMKLSDCNHDQIETDKNKVFNNLIVLNILLEEWYL